MIYQKWAIYESDCKSIIVSARLILFVDFEVLLKIESIDMVFIWMDSWFVISKLVFTKIAQPFSDAVDDNKVIFQLFKEHFKITF